MTSHIARMLKPAVLAASAVALAGLSTARANDTVTRTTTIEQTRVSGLDGAARLIERDTGGRVLEIREHDNRPGEFVAAVAMRHGVQVVRIDAANALTQIAGGDAPTWADRYFTGHEAREMRNARMDISDAIARAADDTDTTPVEARFTQHGAIMAYDVRTPDGTSVVYDAKTGERVANPEAFMG